MKLFGIFALVLALSFALHCKKEEPPPEDKKEGEAAKEDKTQKEKKAQKERGDAKSPAGVVPESAVQDKTAESLRKFRPELLNKEQPAQENGEEIAAVQPKPLKESKPAEEVKPAPEPEEQIPDPGSIITLDDISELKSAKGVFERKTLEGIPVSANYAGAHFKAKGKDEFGLSIQIWRGRNPFEMRQKYQDLFSTYPNSKEIEPVSGSTFFAYLNDMLYVGFSVPMKNYNTVVSCARKLCSSDEIYELSKKAASRIGK